MVNCPFCDAESTRLVRESRLVYAFRDGFPVSSGHTLVVPRRYVASWFDATPEEQQEIWRAVAEIKFKLALTADPQHVLRSLGPRPESLFIGEEHLLNYPR